ncbi:MAG: hypothetical protein R6V28_08995 [Nitriliruptoraceae bacterium]
MPPRDAPRDDRGPLARQRLLWLAFLVGVVALATILTVVVDVTPSLPVALPLVLSVMIGVAALLATIGIDRVLAATPPADDTAAIAELRTRMVLQAVIAETTVLVTTVLAAMIGPRWNIAIGGLAAVAILLRVRPSTPRLRRFDRAWQAAGADVSLERGLVTADVAGTSERDTRSPGHPDT